MRAPTSSSRRTKSRVGTRKFVPSERGYLLHDHSTNGVYVNGVRVLQSQVLSRSDVVRVGSEEFRFYADVIISGYDAGGDDAALEPPPTPQPPAPAGAGCRRVQRDEHAAASTTGRLPTPMPARCFGGAAPASADTTLRVAAVPDAASSGVASGSAPPLPPSMRDPYSPFSR